MVAAMEALRRPVAAEESIREKMRVLMYMRSNKTAPVRARKRFVLFIICPFMKRNKSSVCATVLLMSRCSTHPVIKSQKHTGMFSALQSLDGWTGYVQYTENYGLRQTKSGI